MVLYGLALVPLTEKLREEVPSVIQPWYADDAGMLGKPRDMIAAATRLLMELGPARGYFPEPAKSIFISRPTDFECVEGTRYIGGFICTEESRDEWLESKIQGWVETIQIFSKAAHRYPKTAYAGLTRSLQMEWAYVQRVIPDIGDHFGPVEEAALCKNFFFFFFSFEQE